MPRFLIERENRRSVHALWTRYGTDVSLVPRMREKERRLGPSWTWGPFQNQMGD